MQWIGFFYAWLVVGTLGWVILVSRIKGVTLSQFDVLYIISWPITVFVVIAWSLWEGDDVS